jgi:hypothetical protein
VDKIVVCRNSDREYFDRALRDRQDRGERGGRQHSFGLVTLNKSIGQANSILAGIHVAYPSVDILVVNTDNGFEFPLSDFLRECRKRVVPAGAVVFDGGGSSAYGYVDSAPYFHRGAEKIPISRFAVAGAFYFRSRHVFEHAYHNVSSEEPTMANVSLTRLFEAIHGEKYAFHIERAHLHVWGTADELAQDNTVTNIRSEFPL